MIFGLPLAHFLRLWLSIIAMHTIILNPERIIIGGGFGQAVFDLVLLPVWRELDRWALKEAHDPLTLMAARGLHNPCFQGTLSAWTRP